MMCVLCLTGNVVTQNHFLMLVKKCEEDFLGKKSGHQLLVKSGSTVYRRNRCHIIKTSETPVSSQTVVPKEMPLPSSSGTVSPGHTTVHVPSTLASPMPPVEPPSFQPDVPPTDL